MKAKHLNAADTSRATRGEEPLLTRIVSDAATSLYEQDPELASIMEAEYRRQQDTLTLVASCSMVIPSVFPCEGSFLSNVTAEGYPGARFHGGCVNIDRIEEIAISRAMDLFGARYANVQPLSASIANQIVFAALLKPGETLMGLALEDGGHLSHGTPINVSGKIYHAVSYRIRSDGAIDFDELRKSALDHRPKLIIVGTTAYPRRLDFAAFRDICDEAGALLLADITHVAGLVAAGEHPSPVDIADVTTTCTHKQLYGPRGGLIMTGTSTAREFDLEAILRRGVFPMMQGAPNNNMIAGKARAFATAGSSSFRDLARRIRETAGLLAEALQGEGLYLVTGGTDNHIILADVRRSFGLTGAEAQAALESCGIVTNRNVVPKDPLPPRLGSGIRLGTNSLAQRAPKTEDIQECARFILRVLKQTAAAAGHQMGEPDRVAVREEVRAFCRRLPVPGYL